jgi:TolB-like protein/Tfp pilus assembly protein PilF
MSFFNELKRRNVIRVGIAYAVAAWVVLQVADLVLDAVEAPVWVLKALLLVIALGFVASLIIAWAYELTPEGIKREREVARGESITHETANKLNRITIGLLIIAVLIVAADRLVPEGPQAPPSESATSTANAPAVAIDGPSVAVLPFVNMSADPENEYFSDGIAEELLNVLASIPELKVAARTSAFAYKGVNTKVAQIAEELGVNHVLEGSVRKAGNRVRVTAQLIQASDGFHLWSDTYDRELTNIFAIQDEIAGSIASALKVTLKLETGAAGNLTGTISIAAYEHYLRGMQLWHLRTAASLDAAIGEFNAAIELDPRFAKAHAGLALVWAVYDGYVVTDRDTAISNTLANADRALELDPGSVEAMAAKAQALRGQFRDAEADALFRKVHELNPSFATAFQWHGLLLSSIGLTDEALEQLGKAWRLDPRSRIIGYNLAGLYGFDGVFGEAISILQQVLSFAPDFPDANDYMMVLQIMVGDCGEADRFARLTASLLNKSNPDFQVIADICQASDSELRHQAFRKMVDWRKIDFIDPDHPALMYPVELAGLMAHFGEFDLLFKHLEKAADAQVVLWLRMWQSGDAARLQCDVRLEALEAKFGIPPLINPVACGG